MAHPARPSVSQTKNPDGVVYLLGCQPCVDLGLHFGNDLLDAGVLQSGVERFERAVNIDCAAVESGQIFFDNSGALRDLGCNRLGVECEAEDAGGLRVGVDLGSFRPGADLRSVGVVLVEDVADEEAQHAGIVADGLDEAVSLVADEFIVRALNAVADEVQDFGIGVKEVDERNSALDVLGGCGDSGDRRLHSAGRHGAVAEGNAGDVIAAKLTFGDVAAGLVRRVGVDRTDVILTYRVSTGNGVCRKVARQIPLAHLFTQSLEFFRLKLVEDNGSFGSIVNNTRRRIGNDHIIAKIVDHIFINKMTVIINHNGIRLTGFDGRSILVQIIRQSEDL